MTAGSAQDSFILLQVGARRFALPSDRVTELAPPVRLHSFPHTSPLIEGVIVRRGRIIPVYDIATALTGAPALARHFYLIARCRFGDGGEPSALPLSGNCELVNSETQSATPDSPAFVAGTIRVGDDLVEVVDLEKLIAAHAGDLTAAEGER